MKNKWIILFILIGTLCLGEAANSDKKITFIFKEGSPLMHEYPSNMKLIKPVLTIINSNDKTDFTLPLGTVIWRDKSELGYLIIKYMDKRFSAFGSDAYELVDLERKIIIPIVTDVIAEIDSKCDDILIGVQRLAIHSQLLPVNLGYDYKLDDYDYNESTQILFVIRFDFKIGRFYRVNLITGSHLPDWNQIFEWDSEYEKKMKKMFYVKNDILYYSLDSKRKIVLSFKFPDRNFLYSEIEKNISIKKQ